MDLRKFVDNHPLTVAIVLVVTTASTTFAVANYFSEQNKKNLNSEHTVKVANLKREYETLISELDERLVSIGRGVSSRTNTDGQTNYFNVRNILISREAVSRLSPEYESFQSNRFYVRPSSSKRWTHSQMSEIEFYQLIYPSKIFEYLPEEINVLVQNPNIECWRSNYQLLMSVSTKSIVGFDQFELTLFPYACVQTIPRENLRNMIEIAYKLGKRLQDSLDIKRIGQQLKFEPNHQLDDQITTTKNTQDLVPLVTNVQEISAQISGAESRVFLDEIGKLISSDIVGFFLRAELLSEWILTTFIKDVSFETLAIEKKGNVLYLKSQVNLRSSGKVRGEKTIIGLVQETIFLATAEDLFIIKTQVPTSSGVEEEFSWITQWLTSLRIPARF